MTAGQMTGLVLVAALIGVAGGIGLAAILFSLKAQTDAVRQRRLDAHADWLAAWRTLSRASLSFVAAFRALAAESQPSPYGALRQEEAQRARAAWCEAMAQLDRAEARLLVWSEDPGIEKRLGCLERPTAESLRAAINGGPALSDALRDRLRADDAVAMAIVQELSLAHRGGPSQLFGWIRRGVGFLQEIVDQWSRP